jgi:hypothetical protein
MVQLLIRELLESPIFVFIAWLSLLQAKRFYCLAKIIAPQGTE